MSMSRSSLPRKIAALALATVLVASWASAAEPSSRGTQGLSAQIWNLLVSLTADIGCRANPNGRCAAVTVTPDIGCRLDPNGRCATGTVTPDIGCRLDPNGICLPGS
jgi:hypothetical protein